MTDPTPRPAAKLSSSNKAPAERKPQVEWTRPVKPEPKSGMLQNRKLDMHKSKRAAPSGRRP